MFHHLTPWYIFQCRITAKIEIAWLEPFPAWLKLVYNKYWIIMCSVVPSLTNNWLVDILCSQLNAGRHVLTVNSIKVDVQLLLWRKLYWNLKWKPTLLHMKSPEMETRFYTGRNLRSVSIFGWTSLICQCLLWMNIGLRQ